MNGGANIRDDRGVLNVVRVIIGNKDKGQNKKNIHVHHTLLCNESEKKGLTI